MRRNLCLAIALIGGLLVSAVPAAQESTVLGDMNGDGLLTFDDIKPFVSCLGGGCGHAGPVDWWALDGVPRDYGVSQRHGALRGDATYSDDVPPEVGIGQSIQLDGSGDYVYLGTSLLDGQQFDLFTFTAWFKAPAALDPLHNTLFSFETTDGEFNLMFQNEGTAEPLLKALVYVAGQDECELWGPNAVDNEWHHVIVRKDAAEVTLWLDGLLQDTCPATGPLQLNGLWYAAIGCKYTNGPAHFFEGLIDEVRMFDRALSDQELGVASLPPTGVVPLSAPTSALAMAPDGQYVYAGGYQAPCVTIIDVATLEVIDCKPVGSGPTRFVFNDAGDRLYVSLNPADEMRAFEIPSFGQLCSTAVGSAAAGIALSPDERRAYVCNHVSHTLSIIDVVEDACNPLPQLPVGQGANGVVTNADGTRVYVANADARTVSVVSADTLNDVYTVLCTTPTGLGGNLAYCPLRERLYVTAGDTDELVTVDATDPCNDALWVRIAVDDGPTCVAVSPNGRYAFVTCEHADTLCVIDADTLSVVRCVAVGANPQMVAVHPAYPNGSRVYVANALGQSVVALDPFE